MTTKISDRLRREAAAVPGASGEDLSQRIIDAVHTERKPVPFPAAPRSWAPTALIAAGILAACWVAVSTQRAEPPAAATVVAKRPDLDLPPIMLAASTALLEQDPLTSEWRRMQADISSAGTFLVASMPTLPR